jgi:hypothetical protein
VVAAQAAVGVKTNEVPVAKVVLGLLDLRGKVVTADALHTVKATARLIHEGGGEFVFPVKENRRSLFDAIDALPWENVPDAHAATRQGPRADHHAHHPGPARPRRTAIPARQPGLPDRAARHRPARQASLGRRRARRRQSGARAGRPRRPGPLRPGAMVDRVPAPDPRYPYQEDKSRVRTRSGPRAVLRNLAIGALHVAGRTDITEATRWAARSMDRPFTILGLT